MILHSRHELRRRKAEAKRRRQLKWEAKEILGPKRDELADRAERARITLRRDPVHRLSYILGERPDSRPLAAQMERIAEKVPGWFSGFDTIADLIRKR